MGSLNKLCELFYHDRNLIVVVIHPFVRMMWGKTDTGDVLFSPYTMRKGLNLKSKEQVSFCILLSILSHIFIFQITLYIESLFNLGLLYSVGVCTVQIILLYYVCRLLLASTSATVVFNVKLRRISDDEFRKYLGTFMEK